MAYLLIALALVAVILAVELAHQKETDDGTE